MCIADFISPNDRFRSQAHLGLQRSDVSVMRRVRTRSPPSPTGAASGESAEGEALRKEHSISADEANDHQSATKRGRSRFAKDVPLLSRTSQSPPKQDVTEADHQRAFDRAALLIRQSLDLTLGGGVVFLDTSADNADNGIHTGGLEACPEGPEHSSSNEGLLPFSHTVTSSTTVPYTSRKSSDGRHGVPRDRVVLAAADLIDPDRPSINYGRADSTYKVHISPPELQRMCKAYPRGKLFSLPNNVPTSYYDHEGRPIAGAMSSSMWYLIIIHRQFPDATQVIFVPIFHAILNRWTACFAYTSSLYRIFSYETDYLYTLSFCNAVRAEVLKLATMFMDKQKSDFIGSVSHELRSPLHGILAAIELVSDTECSPFQRSCHETADACAHTLLDTSGYYTTQALSEFELITSVP